MSNVCVYAYSDAAGVRKYVDNTDFNFTGTWSAYGSYVSDRDVVVYSDTKYMSIRTNVGANPIAPVTRTQPAKWSPLVLLYEYQCSGGSGTTSPGEDAVARQIASDAYALAQIGTNTGTAAYDLAASAYALAQIGTNTGTAAYDLAAAAYALALSGTGSYIHDAPDTVKDYHIDWGSGTNQVDASDVPYASSVYSTVAAALDYLLYVPVSISSFTNNVGTVEIGSSVGSVQIDWALNKTIQTQVVSPIGSLAAALRTYTETGPFTSTRTYGLTVSDGTTNANASTSVNFRQKRYWGVSANTSLTDPQILALSSEFATSRAQTRSFTPSAQYIYFAYPTSFGSATFTVNGLLNTAWTLVQRTFVNASGYSEQYNIYRSDNLLTGSFSVTIS